MTVERWSINDQPYISDHQGAREFTKEDDGCMDVRYAVASGWFSQCPASLAGIIAPDNTSWGRQISKMTDMSGRHERCSSPTSAGSLDECGPNEWKAAISREWRRRMAAKQSGTPERPRFSLAADSSSEEEALAMIDVILSNQLTMSTNVAAFETALAAWLKVPYVCMVNSGSSANLLATAALINPERSVRLSQGDEVLVPAVCWSTSVFPIMQLGLTPVFVDTDTRTMNIDLDHMERLITAKTKAVMMVHVLGNSCNMARMMDVVARYKLLVVEDTCESLGSTVHVAGEQKYLGTCGDFGTFSFYYSHHMTTGEGGAVCCHTVEDINLLRCLRAHGWSRHRFDRDKVDAQSPGIDARFHFVNTGFNVRPLEVQGAMGLVQLQKLAQFNQNRVENVNTIRAAVLNHSRYTGQFVFFEPGEGTSPIWFGVALLLAQQYAHQLDEFKAYLTAEGIENRPIISGNMARQTCLKLHGVQIDPLQYTGAEAIQRRGLFFGSHQHLVGQDVIAFLADTLMGFPFTPSPA